MGSSRVSAGCTARRDRAHHGRGAPRRPQERRRVARAVEGVRRHRLRGRETAGKLDEEGIAVFDIPLPETAATARWGSTSTRERRVPLPHSFKVEEFIPHKIKVAVEGKLRDVRHPGLRSRSTTSSVPRHQAQGALDGAVGGR
jgi:hypothetical protein